LHTLVPNIPGGAWLPLPIPTGVAQVRMKLMTNMEPPMICDQSMASVIIHIYTTCAVWLKQCRYTCDPCFVRWELVALAVACACAAWGRQGRRLALRCARRGRGAGCCGARGAPLALRSLRRYSGVWGGRVLVVGARFVCCGCLVLRGAGGPRVFVARGGVRGWRGRVARRGSRGIVVGRSPLRPTANEACARAHERTAVKACEPR
jgi:hypothetical protein